MVYVYDYQEWGLIVFFCDCVGIVVCLVVCFEYIVILSGSVVYVMFSVFLFVISCIFGQVIFVGFFLVYILFGFQNEVVCVVDIDKVGVLFVCVGKGDRLFELVMIIGVIICCWEWVFQVK